MSNPIVLWIKALRAPFFQAVIVPVVLGTAIAWQQTGAFNWWYFVLALVGAMGVNGGTNLANDYFDHLSKNDDYNTLFTPFSGGSRVIQDGLISARKILVGAFISFGLAAVIGIYLTVVRGWPVLAIGLFGVITGYLYTAHPVKLVYRGWGELITGINCGPLVVCGAFYVQAQYISREVVAASLPIGLLVAGILYINEFSDYEPDKAAHKRTLVVRLGLLRAVKGYYLFLAATYLVILIGCLLRLIPWTGLLAFLMLPLSIKAAIVLKAHYNDPHQMIPAMFSHILTHLGVGLLLATGYVLNGFLH